MNVQVYHKFVHWANEEFEGTKGVIRIRISKKDRQHNGQKKKYKQRSTKHTYKTKDRVTRTPLKTGGELRLLNQGFLLVKLTTTWLTVMEYMCHK
jgi:hypothetical protein